MSATALAPAVMEALSAVLGGRVAFGEPLAAHCSIGVGGPADAFCRVPGLDALRRVVETLDRHRVPRLLIGRGTNLLPDDAGFRGAVLRLEGDLARVEVGDGWVEGGGGAALAALVERGMQRDLGGLEFTTGIPGAVGGSLAGNAGTATEALGDRLERVELLVEGGELQSLPPSALGLGYRTSGIRALGGIVTAARFRLEPRPRAEIAARIRTYTEKRRDQPLAQPNVGCIFKNPPGESAGRLIDRAGLKGERLGRAEVSARHANFVVNLGGATAAEIRDLIRRVRARVRAASGILLEPEVVAVDETGRPVSLDPEDDR